jgi:hypothetical protein
LKQEVAQYVIRYINFSISHKEKLPQNRNQLLYPFIRKMMMIQIAVIIEVYDLVSCIKYFIPVTIYSAFVKFFRKNGSLM